MLRLLILLECDQCKVMLSSATNSSNHLALNLTEEICALECSAAQSGWNIYRSQHICDACIINAMAEQRS
ncbi:MAG: hypothetical protein K2X93_29255 [Candidatus Obscuribacterales bacterium]|nr:hypothetical protein [Candidatus Obscuribacterales bacterium]